MSHRETQKQRMRAGSQNYTNDGVKRCHNCGGTEFYIPGDYYIGKPKPLCKRCHPPPAEVKVVKCTEK